ncbi:hypothetical protein F503_02183 [Ophiostoma piceae UAMH 11346]|uniref:Oxidase ustYa n=1 Tax=Ophiostoma piceae (strain UAMH 11346) TaxID=1262450 RepID=S3BW08_OPHP1|nr:hypothetical protein F503_02183 [Ophiostoma piceae UAMH 11346]
MDAKYESVSLGRDASSPPRRDRRSIRNLHSDSDNEDLDDRHSSSSSLTEVDEALLGDASSNTNNKTRSAGQWSGDDEMDRHLAQKNRHGHRRRSLRASIVSWGRWALDTVLLLAILALLVKQQKSDSSSSSSRSGLLQGAKQAYPADEWDFGGDFTGVGPRVSKQIVKFKSDQSYAPMNSSEFFTETTLQKWNQLMPVGMGFVWVNDTHRYHDLPTPIDWPDKTVFTTSVTHQIHCLYTIAQTYSGLKSGHAIPPDHHWHMVHCIDYMREAVMCSADMALEGHETTFPDDNGGSDGWDSKHVCKDFSQVKSYLESVRAYDDQLIY